MEQSKREKHKDKLRCNLHHPKLKLSYNFLKFSTKSKGVFTLGRSSREVKETQTFDWWRVRGQPLGLYTSGQTPKMKGLQSAYIVALFCTFGIKSLDPLRMETQTLGETSFSIKYFKFDERTLTIYFNELLPSPLERNLGKNLLT